MNTQLAYRGVASSVRKMSAEIESALPAFMRENADRFTRVALTALHNPRLLACTQESILSALMQSAQLGLECDGVLGQGYLIPYGKTCTFQLGYRGIISLVRRSGEIARIKSVCVHEGDKFGWDEGQDTLTHVPSLDQKRYQRPVTHCYARATMSNGEVEVIVWSREQIDDHKRRYSKAWNKADSPWSTAWTAMAAKTMLIQLAKILPVDVESHRSVVEDEIRASVSVPVEQSAHASVVDEIIERADDQAIAAREDRLSAGGDEQKTSESVVEVNTIPRVYQTQALADYKQCTSILECQNTHKDRTNGIAFDSSNQNWSEQKRASFMEFEQAIKDERIKTIRESRGQRAKK